MNEMDDFFNYGSFICSKHVIKVQKGDKIGEGMNSKTITSLVLETNFNLIKWADMLHSYDPTWGWVLLFEFFSCLFIFYSSMCSSRCRISNFELLSQENNHNYKYL